MHVGIVELARMSTVPQFSEAEALGVSGMMAQLRSCSDAQLCSYAICISAYGCQVYVMSWTTDVLAMRIEPLVYLGRNASQPLVFVNIPVRQGSMCLSGDRWCIHQSERSQRSALQPLHGLWMHQTHRSNCTELDMSKWKKALGTLGRMAFDVTTPTRKPTRNQEALND